MKNQIAGFVVSSTTLLLAGIAPVYAQVNIANVTFPSDARVINVKNYGAIGNGVADDTVAIQNALKGLISLPQGIGTTHILYLPNGTYRVRGTLAFLNGNQRYCTLEGQSRTGTIIKLDNNTPGFTDPANPRSVISTLRDTPNLADSFRNYIRDLTVDTGQGNAGAIGIDYLSNNTGAIYNVNIKSSDPNLIGVVGLRMPMGGPGPSMIKNVTITGFDTGIQVSNPYYCVTFEHINLSQQRVLGIENLSNMVTFRDLVTNLTVPVYRTGGRKSFFQAIESTFNGGAGLTAVDNANGGMVHLRDVTFGSYANAVAEPGGITGGNFLSEYLTFGWKSATAPPAPQSLRLPIQETPDVAWDAPTTWTNILSFGAISNDGKQPYSGSWTATGDDSVAIQNAIDSGSTTVYFPSGVYTINNTIHIRGNVRRLIGMDSVLQLGPDLAASGNPVFKFENGTAPTVVMERFDADYGPLTGNFIEHSANRTLVLRGITCNFGNQAGYVTNGGTGDVFMEDVTFSAKITRQRAWLRQFNPEGGQPDVPGVHLLNDGGKVWCLGMKTEGVATQIKTINGGSTEVLGGLLASTNYVFPDTPAIINYGSATSVVIGTGFDPAAQQTLVVDEAWDGATGQLSLTDFPYRSFSELQVWNGQYAPSGVYYAYQGNRVTVPIGMPVYLQSQVNSKYTTTDVAGTIPLIASKTSVGTTEQFTVVDRGNPNVALLSLANNKYVCAENNGNSPLIANRTTADLWETFQWIDMGNNTAVLRSLANGKYVTAPSSGSASLIANGTTINSAATFKWSYPAMPKVTITLNGVTMARNADGTLSATVTLKNTGGVNAVGAAIISANLGGTLPAITPLAVSIASIPAGGTVTRTLTFPSLSAGTSTNLNVSGTYFSGNTFSLSSRVTIP